MQKGFNYCLADLFYFFSFSCFIFLSLPLLYAQRIHACKSPALAFFFHSLRIIFSMTMSLPETYFLQLALRKGTTLHLNAAFFTMSWKCVIVNGDASPTITRTIYFTLVKTSQTLFQPDGTQNRCYGGTAICPIILHQVLYEQKRSHFTFDTFVRRAYVCRFGLCARENTNV